LWIDAPRFWALVTSERIVEELLGGRLHVQQLMRVDPFLKFMVHRGYMTVDALTMLWNSCAGKHETEVSAVYTRIHKMLVEYRSVQCGPLMTYGSVGVPASIARKAPRGLQNVPVTAEAGVAGTAPHAPDRVGESTTSIAVLASLALGVGASDSALATGGSDVCAREDASQAPVATTAPTAVVATEVGDDEVAATSGPEGMQIETDSAAPDVAVAEDARAGGCDSDDGDSAAGGSSVDMADGGVDGIAVSTSGSPVPDGDSDVAGPGMAVEADVDVSTVDEVMPSVATSQPPPSISSLAHVSVSLPLTQPPSHAPVQSQPQVVFGPPPVPVALPPPQPRTPQPRLPDLFMATLDLVRVRYLPAGGGPLAASLGCPLCVLLVELSNLATAAQLRVRSARSGPDVGAGCTHGDRA
jgi:hypothetical protein